MKYILATLAAMLIAALTYLLFTKINMPYEFDFPIGWLSCSAYVFTLAIYDHKNQPINLNHTNGTQKQTNN